MYTWPERHSPCQTQWTPQILSHNGFSYHFEAYGNKNHRRVIYRCAFGNRSVKDHCKAIAYIDFSLDLKSYSFVLKTEHTCKQSSSELPYYTEAEIQTKLCELYNDPKFNHMPDPIFTALLQWINDTTPKGKTVNSIAKNKVRNYIYNLNVITQNQNIHFENSKTLRNERFLLFEISINDNQIVAFASDYMLSCVKECSIIGIDSTFHSSPKKFYQLCVLTGRTSVMNLPILYLLLPNKKKHMFLLLKLSLVI